MESTKRTLKSVAKILNVDKRILEEHIQNNDIVLDAEGLIDEKYIDIIRDQQSRYMGLKAYIMTHTEGRFDPRYVKNRNQYIEFLEYEKYFHISRINPRNEKILYDYPGAEEQYILREDIPLLNAKSTEFFRYFDYTDKELSDLLLEQSNDEKKKQYIIHFIKNKNGDKYTSVVTEFIEIVLQSSPLEKIGNEELNQLFESTNYKTTEDLLRAFYRYVREKENVKYGVVKNRPREPKPAVAYSEEECINLAIMVFNDEFAEDNRLLVKAFDNHFYAEMWLFIALHFVCGWRAADICNNWIYPAFDAEYDPFKIRNKNLKEDILNGRISDDIYEKIGRYLITKIELANVGPSKTNRFCPEKLRADALLNIRIILGKLSLIGMYLFETTGDGLMRSTRIASYCNWVNGKAFWGEYYLKTFGQHNIQTRRINKAYLQGVEIVARGLGNSPIMAHMIAAYARSHRNPDSTKAYLNGGFANEKPEDALFWMIQRGVKGLHLYTALLLAAPDFGKLSKAEQSYIIERIPINAYELETMGELFIDKEEIRDVFRKGKEENVDDMLKTMLEVGRGRGKAKDKGVFCKCRALGYSCERPRVKSCIAAMCDHCIFTTDGLPSLLRVLVEYYDKFKTTGNKKYFYALNDHLIPYYADMIEELKADMSDEEKKVIDNIMGDYLECQKA